LGGLEVRTDLGIIGEISQLFGISPKSEDGLLDGRGRADPVNGDGENPGQPVWEGNEAKGSRPEGDGTKVRIRRRNTSHNRKVKISVLGEGGGGSTKGMVDVRIGILEGVNEGTASERPSNELLFLEHDVILNPDLRKGSTGGRDTVGENLDVTEIKVIDRGRTGGNRSRGIPYVKNVVRTLRNVTFHTKENVTTDLRRNRTIAILGLDDP